MTTGLDQLSAGFDDGRRVGYVLEHFHASDHIKALGLLDGQGFNRDFAVLHIRGLSFQRMQLGHFERLGSQVNAQGLRACTGHGVSQDPATAAHVQHFLAFQGRDAVDPIQTQGVDLV